MPGLKGLLMLGLVIDYRGHRLFWIIIALVCTYIDECIIWSLLVIKIIDFLLIFFYDFGDDFCRSTKQCRSNWWHWGLLCLKT
jgi:hypothetical protein